MSKVSSTNYTASGTNFPIANDPLDALNKSDLFTLQKALEEHTHDTTRGLPARRLNTSSAPGAAGQVRINGDALQWWGNTAGAIQTAVSLTGTETLSNKTLASPTMSGTVSGGTYAGATLTSPTINSPIITTPTIGSFVNAGHNHQNAAGGGQIAAAALSDGTTGTGAIVRATAPTVAGITVSGTRIQVTGNTTPGSGTGVELAWTGSVGEVIAFNRTGTTYQPIRLHGSELQFYTGGSSKALIDGSGRLGIGTTPSAWGSASAVMQIGYAGAVAASTTDPIVNLGANYYHDGSTNRAIQGSGAAILSMNGSSRAFGFYTSEPVAAGAAFTDATQRAVISALGVGVQVAKGGAEFSIDASSQGATVSGYSLPNNTAFTPFGNVAGGAFAGLFVLNDVTDGLISLWMVGGGLLYKIEGAGQHVSGSPAAGQTGVSLTGTSNLNVQVHNFSGATHEYRIFAIRTRTTN